MSRIIVCCSLISDQMLNYILAVYICQHCQFIFLMSFTWIYKQLMVLDIQKAGDAASDL